MKINEIKINSYGKLKDKEIKCNDGINLIYGKNESGKSTLLRFIENIFYGISKNKKGKEFSDYDNFLPWSGEEFSGRINYELDNGEKYEVFRDFKKKNPKIFNNEKEDISKNFNIDKNKGNEFFYEQTNIDEDLFLSTIVSYQQRVKLEKNEQNFLVQKIANIVGTGEDNVSYKLAMDRITRKQRDEVGSQKSREKPINVLQRKIETLEQEKENLKDFENKKYDIEENKNNLENEIINLEKEKEYISSLKNLENNQKIEEEKINLKEKIKKKNIEKINNLKINLNKKIEENKKEKNKKIEKINLLKNKNKKINIKFLIILILFILINIIQFIFIKNKIINISLIAIIPILLIIWIFIKMKKNKEIKLENEENKKILDELKTQEKYLENEIEIIENNNKNIEKELETEKDNLLRKNNSEKEKLLNNYKNKINYEKLLEYNKLKNPTEIFENMQNDLSHKKIQLHQLELDSRNIEPKLDNLSKIEEELENDKEQLSSLEKLNKSMELAKEVLEKSYEEMKNMVAPKFTKNLSENISKITNGKYKNVRVHDELGLIVELEDGSYVEVGKLSVGTIDQLYLSLRLSMIDDLSEERMPIFLDESFAYFDADRLKNILKYLSTDFNNRQIFIFTCTDREKDILEELKVKFNLISMD